MPEALKVYRSRPVDLALSALNEMLRVLFNAAKNKSDGQTSYKHWAARRLFVSSVAVVGFHFSTRPNVVTNPCPPGPSTPNKSINAAGESVNFGPGAAPGKPASVALPKRGY